MARRGSNKKDDGAGCLFSIFEIVGGLLLALLVSDDPSAKKIGLGIIGAIMLFLICVQAGPQVGLLLFFAVVILIGIIIFAVTNHSGANSRPKKENQTPSAKYPDSFEEQLHKVELQAQRVCAEDFQPHTKKEYTQSPVSGTAMPKTKDIYYHSAAEAAEAQHVPAGYRKIMIERIQKTEIKECPGLVWKDDTTFYVLPLLKNSKLYHWPLASIPIILYEKRNNPNVDREFAEVGKADIAAEFEELFPEYPFGKEGVYTGKFILPVGLEVTNTSGKVLFDLLPAEFYIVDDITQSTWYEKEIKELYQKNVLKENGIISFAMYEEAKENLLRQYRDREKNETKLLDQLKSAEELGI